MRALSRPPSLSQQLIAPATLVLAALLAYHGSFSVPFFFDDVIAVTNNPTIRDLGSLGTVLSPPADGGGVMGRPLVNLSLAVNYAIGRTNPAGYHLFNLIVHVLATLALFGLVRRTLLGPAFLRRLGSATALAFTTALLWTVHPLQTESVTCVIQRTELLVGVFYLLTLYGFTRSLTSTRWIWPTLTVLACALGMASKEVMVSAPLTVLLYDRTFAAGSFANAWRLRRRLYLGLATTWLVLIGLLVGMGGGRADAAGFGLGVSAWSYALKQCEAIVTYLKLAIWPHPLVIDYGTDVVTRLAAVAPQFVAIVLLLGAMVFAVVRRPVLGFALFWVFALLAPSSSIVPLVSQTMAEHRMYLPLAALVALAVLGLHHVLANRAKIAGALIAVALCALSIARNATLQDEVTLWRDTVAKVPGNARAHGSLGLALSSQGREREALPPFEHALQLEPNSVATLQNIGNAHHRLGEYATAAGYFRRAVKADPTFASGYSNLGAALFELGDATGALESLNTALRLAPDHLGAHRNAARTLFNLGRYPEAAVHYEAVLRQQPDSPESHYDLGLALARTGQLDRAAHHFGEALRRRPSPGSYFNYAQFLENAGRREDAISALEAALRLQPDFLPAREELARLRRK